MPNTRKISAIIYDLDDTMVNSDPLHVRAWEELLKEYGHNWSDIPEGVRASYLGMRVVDICNAIIDYLNLNIDRDEFYRRRIELFLEIVEKELEPMPGLLESLERFKNAGFKMAVASSGAQKYIDLVLDKFSIRNYFDAIVTGDDVKIGKPHPDAYLITAEKLHVDPAACLVLEDATKGIQSAKAAGCMCIAIRNPNVPPQDFTEADVVVDRIDDITLKKIEELVKQKD